ncbi:ABC transporter permease [Fulvivirga ulvae]|uniref:ABC transporter permease n=1 Tax=Fulvivirga ulvae TaxID=2904245 RepID=UPI001F2653F7|nr:ABC transporter permease [Fulvivirga ulvae]UII33628.1 ABC transporter permease [Fulvivirga ulvae]
MFKHNFITILRSFKRNKSSFIINLIGLSTGLACTLLIALWVQDEFKVDQFHENKDRLFQILERQTIADETSVSFTTVGVLAETLSQDFPEIDYATAVTHYSWFPKFGLSTGGDRLIKSTGQFVSEDFFNVFSYELLKGNKSQVMKDRNAIVISRSTAEKLFGSVEEAVGKTVQWHLADLERDAMVTGVFDGPPAYSTEQFDFVISFEIWKEMSPAVLDWGNNGTHIYATLKEEADVDEFNGKIMNLLQSRIENTNRELFATPFAEEYLYGKYEGGQRVGGRIENVRLFSIIAIFILLMACVNFMNLSTAKALRRAKEVGIKKAIGADRSVLVRQYLGESLLLAVVGLCFALVIIALILPKFNEVTGKELSMSMQFSTILFMILVTMLTGILSGSYPALYLSQFNPAVVLKGKLANSKSELFIRKGLVIFQFALSVILIVSVIIVYKQIDLLQTKDLGYKKDQLIYFEKEGQASSSLEMFTAELKKVPGVLDVSSTSNNIIGSYNKTSGVEWEGKNENEPVEFEVVDIDYDFIETMGMTMKSGRSFSRDYGADNTKIIFNEAAIDAMSLDDPVNKHVNLWGEDMEIVGVVSNFHYESFYKEVKPLLFKINPDNTIFVMARIRGDETQKVVNDIRSFYEKYNPGYTFDYVSLNDKYQEQYASEKQIGLLSTYFACLAIIISCLGLFGLAAFTTQSRVKEIGLRKIFGSSIPGIVVLLTKDFTKIVLIAITIAIPISYLLAKSWLQGFAYKTSVSVWVYVFAAFLALLISWITVGYQAVKAAYISPIKTSRE